MDPTLKAAVDSAANMLRRTRGGPEGVAAAAAAVDSVRRALNDTHASLSLRPRIADDSLPMLLSTQKPVGSSSSSSSNGASTATTTAAGGGGASSSVSSPSSSGTPGSVNMSMAASAATIMYGAAVSYDKAAGKLLDSLGEGREGKR